jgi:tetratricopeptide (TPR) repeat protein
VELFELTAASDAFETYLEARPNDIEAGFEYANTLVALGRHEEARRVVLRLSRTIPRQDAANRGMLIQHASKSRDFDLAGELARETLADHPFNSFVLVEAHWALLRTGEIDLAREVVERLEASEVGFVAQMGLRMNQLCAEGNRIAAEPLASQLIDHPSAFITAWHAYRAMGDDDAAYARLLQLDQPGPPPPRLRALLVGDPAFDASRFPHLSAALLDAGGRLAAPAPAAVRCPPA